VRVTRSRAREKQFFSEYRYTDVHFVFRVISHRASNDDLCMPNFMQPRKRSVADIN